MSDNEIKPPTNQASNNQATKSQASRDPKRHILPHNNLNRPIINVDNPILPTIYFNDVRVTRKESYTYSLSEYESVCVVVHGKVTITVQEESGTNVYQEVGERTDLFSGKPDSVYIPLNAKVDIVGLDHLSEIFIAGGRYGQSLQSFRVSPRDVDTVQYGSDETKTHRKIHHVLGQANKEHHGRLLVSELFTVGEGGWSGFPPHKHDEERPNIETKFDEAYHFRFNPQEGFAAQFLYKEENDFGPVEHVKNGSTILIDKGYHPVVVAPGYAMYYFTILCGHYSNSLIQYFQPQHAYQLQTIPGIMDMVNKFK